MPGSPIFEATEKLSSFHRLECLTIEHEPENCESYFDDKIPQINLDTGDLTSGSDAQQTVRDPRSSEIERKLSEADPQVVPPGDFFLSKEDRAEIFNVKQGIIVSEIADFALCRWATHVVFLDVNEKSTLQWFAKRLKCYSCGATSHLEDKPPKIEGICDRCGSDLKRMPQDDPELIRKQFHNFRNSFWKFQEYAKSECKYKRINVSRSKSFNSVVRSIDRFVNHAIEAPNWYNVELGISISN
jgi:rRNA maturation endonuclease Nob1